MPSLLLPLALLLSTPAHALGVFPVGLRDVRVGMSGASFTVMVEVEREKGLPVRLRGLDYALRIDQAPVASAEIKYKDDKVVLRKGQPVRVGIPVTLDAAEAMKIVSRGFRGGSNLRVAVVGNAKVSVLGLPFRLPYKTELVDLSSR